MREGVVRERISRVVATALSLVALSLAQPAQAETPVPSAASTCLDCHLGLDDDRLSPPARAFAEDVHAKRGLTCASCHGGDPTQDDVDLAHDRRKGFRGKPAPAEIPELCGSCHASATFMKRFNSSLRVDQLSEYRTSTHGKKLATGDVNVAQCASCHGAHGVLPVIDARSPVSSGRIAQTCNRCHGDATLMARYQLPSDAYVAYARSVHYEARRKGDLSAPTCNSCHGNHGAAAPEVDSVANVCGTCHAVFAETFNAGPHAKAFREAGLPGCVSCHDSHAILQPSESFLKPGPEYLCGNCHEAGSAEARTGAAILAEIEKLKAEKDAASTILRRARLAGMEVSQPMFELTKADEALTKVRTDVHLVSEETVREGAARGIVVAQASRRAGERAMRERDFRRKGLLVSLVFIAMMVAGLLLLIRSWGDLAEV